MNLQSFNNDFNATLENNKDVLSVFRQNVDKKITIQQGMSIREISDVVSEKIINVVKEQFEITKEDFNTKEVKK
jgi:stress response protein YsnF